MPSFILKCSVAALAVVCAPATFAQPSQRMQDAQRAATTPAADAARAADPSVPPVAAMSDANAQGPLSVQQVVERTLLTNPEIQARYHDFRASMEGQSVQRGALLPSVDTNARIGREYRSSDPNRGSYSWNRPGFTVELRQLIFDGFRASNAVKQAGYEKLARYYDLLATSDDVALAAAQAYLDLQRYRTMELLARQNYKLHDDTLAQIRERADSGVGRRVDLEQAGGRLSLAQTNLMTETANLLDVEQRFQRLTGIFRPGELQDPPEVQGRLPVKPTDFNDSLRRNPSFLSTQASLQAANANTAVAKGAFAPRFDFVAATGRDRGELSEYRNVQSSSVGVQMSYNLYRGGSDTARVRQTAAQAYAARDVRDYTCRNVQQELAIAWNNISRLRQQIPFLEDHELATTKVRDAYRQQFQIGQRSLLDLLDTENELFDSRRALTNGVFDLKVAEYRWLALSHRLLPTLALQPARDEMPEENQALETTDEVIKLCNSNVPDEARLAPVRVRYNDGVTPPTLEPVEPNRANPPVPQTPYRY